MYMLLLPWHREGKSSDEKVMEKKEEKGYGLLR